MRKWFAKMKVGSKYVFMHIFYRQSFVKSMLQLAAEDTIHPSSFIDYNIVLNNQYYKDDFLKMNLRIKTEIRTRVFPYKELINYIKHPTTKIQISNKSLSDIFRLPEELLYATTNAYTSFIQTRLLVSDDTTLRIKALHSVNDNLWMCSLQKAKYTDQIRTNLTIDFPLESITEETMRTKDLGENNTLRPFEESILANTIGVSAIWVMKKKSGITNISENMYFLMPRKKNTGIYNGMLGTISGVVTSPQSDKFNSEFLEDYLTLEIQREFYEETGINSLIDSGYLKCDEIRITPLAFVRDLTRGGKPQVFYIITTPFISPTKINNSFKTSWNGPMEFDDNFFTRIPKYHISPETQLNLVYALSYIQAPKKLDFVDLN